MVLLRDSASTEWRLKDLKARVSLYTQNTPTSTMTDSPLVTMENDKWTKQYVHVHFLILKIRTEHSVTQQIKVDYKFLLKIPFLFE